MNDKFAWIPESRAAFFDEDGSEKHVDLIGFQYDKDAAHGMLDRIVTGCRAQLDGLGTDEIRAILRFADATLFEILPSMNLVDADGASLDPESISWSGANQLDFIHVLIMAFGDRRVLISDLQRAGEVESWELSPARFCAAFALRMAFNTSRDYLGWEDARELRDYYLAQAAVAYGLMQGLAADQKDGIPGAIHLARSVRASRNAARKRWDESPKTEAMLAIREEWEAMRSSGRHLSDAEFARRAMERYSDVITNEGSIKNAISRWRRESSRY